MRAPCRVCHRDSALTRRGLVWWHTAALPAPVPRPRCPGAGRAPFGAAESRQEPAPLPGQVIHPLPWQRERSGPQGTVYLVCFDAPFGHARHYLGWAGPGNLGARLAHHAAGSGSNLLRHVGKAGISWELVRTWPGDRHLERRLKNRGGHTRLCPSCSPSRVSP